MALQLSLAMVLSCLVPEHGILRVTELCCRNPGQLSSHPRCLQSYAAGILDNSPAIQGVYRVMLQESWTTLQPSKVSTELCCRNPGQLSSHPRCLHNIIVFCSVRKSQQELVSMNCMWGLLCQLLRQQLKLAPSDRRWLHCILKRGLLFPRNC